MVASNHRQVFADRFTRLYSDAGDPTGEELARRARPKVYRQRIHDWRNGSIPHDFAGFQGVLALLIERAKKSAPNPAFDGLYSVAVWEELWRRAAATPATEHAASNGSPTDDGQAPDEECPYRGLAAFGAEHAAMFFGRDAATHTLTERLAATEGLLLLVAPSGAGKSSLLGAGLIPAIRAGELGLPGAEDWPIIYLTPEHDPFASLARQAPELANIRAKTDTNDQRPDTDDRRRARAEHARATVAEYVRDQAGPDARLILLVDQLEELFTLCAERDRHDFIELLDTLATATPPALVVAGMRADFYGRCLEHPTLVTALEQRHMVLPPMTVRELTEVITGPARTAGLRLEPALADLLIKDAGVRAIGRTRNASTAEVGVLPLLSHALRATWQYRDRRRLTVAGYQRAGGVHGAVTQTAERALARLDSPAAAAAMAMLITLTRVGEDHTQDTRRHYRTEQLLDQASDRAAAQRALDAFVAARLVSVDTETTQITHEALLQVWPRLRRAIDQRRAALLGVQRLEEDAETWATRDRDPSRLYRGEQLDDAQRWAQTSEDESPALSDRARSFLAAALAARDRAAEELRRRARRDRRVRLAIAVLAVVGVLAALIAASGWQTARHREADAQFGAVRAQADRLQPLDPALAARLDLVAHRMRPDNRAVVGRVLSTEVAPLSTPLPGPSTAGVDYTGWRPDGRVLATAANDIRLWDVSDPTRPRQIGAALDSGRSFVSAAVFSPDGRLLASSSGDGKLRLWDVSDPARPTPLGPPAGGEHGSLSLLAFSPDGRTVATAANDGTITLWNVTDPAHLAPAGPPLTGHAGPVRSVAFSPDGRLLASGGDDRSVRIWNVADLAHAGPAAPPLPGHTELVRSVAWNHAGRIVASGSNDRTARLWDITDPAHPAPLGAPLVGNKGSIWSVGFRADDTLATGGQDGTARLWNITNPARAAQIGAELPARTGGLMSIGWSPDGRYLAAGGDDGSAALWDIPVTVLTGQSSRIFTLAYSPDGRTLATGSADHSVRLWDLADPARPAPLGGALPDGHNGIVIRIAWSPNGRYLASESGEDRTVRIWDLADRTRPVLAGPPIPRGTQYQGAIAWSPDSRLLVTSDTDRSIQLWDATDPGRPRQLGAPFAQSHDFVTSAAFTPDGRSLAVSSHEGVIGLWDLTTPEHPAAIGQPLATHTGKIREVTFSPDGKRMATTGEDKTVRLWDVSTLSQPKPAATLTGLDGAPHGVAFSPDGQLLAAGGADSTARVWPLADLDRANEDALPLTGHTGTIRDLTFTPDGRAVVTGSEDNTVRIWRLDPAAAIERICATTHATLTESQWTALLPGLAYSPPC